MGSSCTTELPNSTTTSAARSTDAEVDGSSAPSAREPPPQSVLNSSAVSGLDRGSATSVASPTLQPAAVPRRDKKPAQRAMSSCNFTSVVPESPFERPEAKTGPYENSSLSGEAAEFGSNSSAAHTPPSPAKPSAPKKPKNLSTRLLLRNSGGETVLLAGAKKPTLFSPTKLNGDVADDEGEATPIGCRPDGTASTVSRSSADSASSSRKGRRAVQFLDSELEE